MVQVYSYAESQDVASAVAQYVIKIQDSTLSTSDSFKIAVSGGSLGKVLKKGLIDNEENYKLIKWSKWEVYFSDERIVPLNHEDSNYGLFNEMILETLKAKNAELPKIFTINEKLIKDDGSTDSEIAEEYEELLPLSIDLVLLGCGPDGHTCSLFPNHELLKENQKRITFLQDSPKPPPRRITFTFPQLKTSKNIAFVAEGAGKAPVLAQIFNDKEAKLPCKLVNELDVPVSWFVNDAAVNGVDVLTSKF